MILELVHRAQMKHRNYREFQDMKLCFIFCNNNKLPSESNSFAASARRKLDTGHVANDARLAVHLACGRRVHHLHRLVRPLRPQPPGNAVSGRVADVFAGERRHCGFEEILQLGELSLDPLFSGEVGLGSVASFFTGDRIIFLGL